MAECEEPDEFTTKEVEAIHGSSVGAKVLWLSTGDRLFQRIEANRWREHGGD